MPKIVINEYDKTKDSGVEYSNFTVVVPGFVNAISEFNKVADENGIFECTNIDNFIKYIGKIGGDKVAKGPIVSKNWAANRIKDDEYYHDYKDNLYTREAVETTSVGYLVGKDNNTNTFYKYTKVNPGSDIDQGEDPKDINKAYFFIETGAEGNDASTTSGHIGNQIAYELVKQGYTVLYKKLDNSTEYKDGTETGKTGIEAMQTVSFWECLKDRSSYDFRYIITGGYYNETAYEKIAKIATFVNGNYITNAINDITTQGRGDCIALVDIIENNITTTASQSAKLDAIKNQVKNWGAWADQYTAIFVPKVIYNIKVDSEYGNNTTFPASLHYLLCAQNAFITNGYSEWYAVAGYTRGIGPYAVGKTTLGNFGEIAINTLEPRYSDSAPNTIESLNHAINVVAKIRNNYYLWGNRTAKALTSFNSEDAGLKAGHFLNIRQLCCTLKKELYVACRKFTFSPNSDLLWINFCNTIRPTLEKMKADQGIRDYKIIKVASSTKALLKAKIRIVPIEAVEDFEINVYLEDSISGTVASAEEV